VGEGWGEVGRCLAVPDNWLENYPETLDHCYLTQRSLKVMEYLEEFRWME